ncbi:hypothetical protein GCM10027181_15290 [Rheinheimera gaetbuli]
MNEQVDLFLAVLVRSVIAAFEFSPSTVEQITSDLRQGYERQTYLFKDDTGKAGA